MVAVSTHTHDGVDWAARLPGMRLTDALQVDALTTVAERLVADLPPAPTVLDLGSGSGGMSAAITRALRTRGGGRVVLVDAVPELLAAAAEAANEEGAGEPPESRVRVETVLADAAGPDLERLAPKADLIWASAMVHHLPDQQRAVDGLAGMLNPRGLLALAEGGLEARSLPWDLGLGEPGIEGRLHAARDQWFREMREAMPGAVAMPYGWGTALRKAGLESVAAFSYLVDQPAPPSEAVLHNALDRLAWFAEAMSDRLSAADLETIGELLDPAGRGYLGLRDDVFLLSTRTVHYGLSR